MGAELDKNRIREIVHSMVCEEAHLGEGLELPEDIRLIENLGFDSVQLISLIARIEETFNIEFMGSRMLFDRFDNLGHLCDLVKEMMEEKQCGRGENDGAI